MRQTAGAGAVINRRPRRLAMRELTTEEMLFLPPAPASCSFRLSSMNFFSRLLPRVAALALCVIALGAMCLAQQTPPPQGPMTNAEFLAIVRQLPARPGMRDQP